MCVWACEWVCECVCVQKVHVQVSVCGWTFAGELWCYADVGIQVSYWAFSAVQWPDSLLVGQKRATLRGGLQDFVGGTQCCCWPSNPSFVLDLSSHHVMELPPYSVQEVGFQSVYEERILCDILSNKAVVFLRFSDLWDFSFCTLFFWWAASYAGNNADCFVCLTFGLFSASIVFSRFHFLQLQVCYIWCRKKRPNLPCYILLRSQGPHQVCSGLLSPQILLVLIWFM